MHPQKVILYVDNMDIVDDIFVDLMGECESCLMMCDISAAFDTVPHQLLSDKLVSN